MLSTACSVRRRAGDDLGCVQRPAARGAVRGRDAAACAGAEVSSVRGKSWSDGLIDGQPRVWPGSVRGVVGV
jgi:hypothetical protein